jgi:hypothetical protein
MYHEKLVFGKSEDPWSTIRSDCPYFGIPWASIAEKVWITTDQLHRKTSTLFKWCHGPEVLKFVAHKSIAL